VGSTPTASRRGQIGALATVALWCTSFALIKHLVDAGLAAQDVAVGRYVVAWPGFAYLLWRAGGLPGLRRGEALRILAASFGGVTVYHLALNAGERTTDSGVAALIVALGPATTLALALAVGLESYAPRRLAGIALAFAGVVVVVVLGSGAHFSLHGLCGPLLVLLAPIVFALYNVLYKPLLARYDLEHRAARPRPLARDVLPLLRAAAGRRHRRAHAARAGDRVAAAGRRARDRRRGGRAAPAWTIGGAAAQSLRPGW
jgi:drug/metabolite transporter (DMT)-like permease